MKLGLGLYKHMLDSEHYHFARQAGATHIVAHLVDYFAGGEHNPRDNQPTGSDQGWGRAGDPDALWTVAELKQLRADIESHGLVLEAIENLDPAHWHDILLDGPKRAEHTDNIKTIIRRMGEAGIPTLGYNFSIAGVGCRVTGPFARGGAESVGMDGIDHSPLPEGLVWNMHCESAKNVAALASVSEADLWSRYKRFLDDVLPIAEQSGVRIAAHPEDPPVERLRDTPRLAYTPQRIDQLIQAHSSTAHNLELCIGTIAEMPGSDVYRVVDMYTRLDRVAYIHMRNIHDKAPHYKETFIDEGDTDMLRVIRILIENNYDGVLIPDHTPQMSCPAPWEAGMAHALGYIQGLIQSAQAERSEGRHA